MLEVTVTMTVSTLIVVAAVATVRSVTAARAAGSGTAEMDRQGRQAMLWMRRSLRNAVRTPVDDRIPVFVGGPDDDAVVPHDRIDFFAYDHGTLRPNEPESDLYEVSFQLILRAADDRVVLVERRDPALDDEPAEGGVLTVVAENVVEMEFEYFDGEEWTDEWLEERKEFPRMIRMRVLVEEDVRWRRRGRRPRNKWYTMLVTMGDLHRPGQSNTGTNNR